ncbi:hypothetical protein P7H16_26630 [Paenibacillus larvae]|nr:hypothetical protein [Paenibacillus larvae]MDT2249792.1 hypothetical protein [Paenibacillus larvae]
MGNVKYREVKRAAKVGEKIRAVDARPMWTPHYENGDEFEVVKTRTYGILGRRIGGDDEKIKSRLYNLCDSEYVVLEPETKITEYRQVKRKAKVGETVKIIHSYPPYYREKDIAKVCKVIESSGAVLADFTLNEDYRGDGRWLVCLDNYVVFEPIAESDEISDIKNEMERLTGELATLALRVSKLEEPVQPEKSSQEIRDEIVEKAKADIKGLAINEYGYVDFLRHFTGSNPPFYRVRHFDASLAEFIVNRRKKTVVCLLRSAVKKEIYARGIAKCAPGDAFNSHIGRAIALRRALGLEVPAEYLRIPNPTEFKIGDIVIRYTWVNTMHPYYIFQIGTETDGKSVLSLDSINSYCTLIDDSHEEGALDAYLA